MSSPHDDVRLVALAERTVATFEKAFGASPAFFVAAPGRVNLIGEHTDYNDGFVLPAAIDRYAFMAVAPRADRRVRLVAADFGARSMFDLDHIATDGTQRWSNYQRGVAWALQEAGFPLAGLDVALSSDIPVGSGLSSSAAVEIAMAYAFQIAGDLAIDGAQRALLCQKAENDFVGMNCGIMDQFIVSLGERDHALLIDCRTLEYSPVPLPSGCDVVICDTKKRRGLVDSEYNRRREECERGAGILQVSALRDVSMDQLQAHRDTMDEITFRRCHHVVSECQRTLDAVDALRGGYVARFGQLMNASHASLRDYYEVSCAELDAMVSAAWDMPGTLGARMTGAGFGGCTVNLVDSASTDAFVRGVTQAYTRATGIIPEVYVCQASDGVRLID